MISEKWGGYSPPQPPLFRHPCVSIPYSGLFSNQKFSHKCLNINFGGFIFEVSIFRWFYFRSQYIFRSISSEAVLHELFERDDITKFSIIKQHCNYRCSVMLTHS